MKVLILGGAGMLGHKLWQVFTQRFDAYITLRKSLDAYASYNLFNPKLTVDHVSVQDLDSILRAIKTVRPKVIVNCIGIVKQSAAAKDPLMSILINALFPHRLAQICQSCDIRLIHISTDCVFSGRKGNYRESDMADPEDLYGRTKLLGEVSSENCLTLRTSIIGRELETSHGLVEWLLSQEGQTIRGYTKAIFSGFTTCTLAEIISRIITEHPKMEGLWHVASDPISKYDLLMLLKQSYGLNVRIIPDETVLCERSLNADRFRQATGIKPPSWPDMIERMGRDIISYEKMRRSYANK